MACSRCTQTPELSYGTCKVYISTLVDDLFIKLKEITHRGWTILSYSNEHIEVSVKDFEDFITKLTLDDLLVKKEWHDIHILPLSCDDGLNFTTFLKTKTLAKWIGLLKSKELVYILENKSLITFFQPIVNIEDNSIYGYELLSRGIKQDGSVMPPFEMFHLAKESDLTFNLDRQARETCIINAALKKVHQKLFINFLPSVIYDPKVCLKTTTELISHYHLDPKNITFEVVETDEVKDTDHLKHILDFYREKGFNIALDDMGSGYSSLNNLAKLHPDYIKVDMEIIRNIHKDALKQSIFKALVAMSKNMDIYVLAEGVETKDELDYVKSEGAHLVQGYYFGKPDENPLRELNLR